MKKLLLLTLLSVAALTFAACDENTSEKETDTKATTTTESDTTPAQISEYSLEDMAALAVEIINSKGFDDPLSEIPTKVALKQYDLEESDITEIISYQSTGATSEEITIIKASSDLTKKITAHITSQKKLYESYKPEEVATLDTFIVKEIGDVVVIVVAKHPDVVNELLKNY